MMILHLVKLSSFVAVSGNDGIFYWKDNLYLTEIKKAMKKSKRRVN